MANLGYLQLTRNCLQRCRFCSNPPTGVDLTVAEMEREIDVLADLGYDGIILTGGEPTMSPLLLPALKYATKKGLFNRMITNGQLLEDKDFFQKVVTTDCNIFTSLSIPIAKKYMTSSLSIPALGKPWSLVWGMFQRWGSPLTSTPSFVPTTRTIFMKP